MSTKVTIDLPDETYRRAEHLAQLTGRALADILSETLDISLQPLGTAFQEQIPIVELSDSDLLNLSDSQMELSQDLRFKELMGRRAQLSSEEHTEYLALMQVYQEGLLRKAQALNEAVRRGLRKSLEP